MTRRWKMTDMRLRERVVDAVTQKRIIESKLRTMSITTPKPETSAHACSPASTEIRGVTSASAPVSLLAKTR